MNIELIENKRFTEIYVEGVKLKEVHRRLYKSYLKEIVRTKNKKDLSDLLLRIDVKIARVLVYKWLSLRGFMKSELERKLAFYKIDPEATGEILQKCEKLGYVDDKREGKLFIERGKRKGIGPKMLSYKLAQKAPELKGMPFQSYTEDEQRNEIKRWIEKKTRSSNFSDTKVKHRLYRFLSGKGFDDSLIREQLFVDE